MKQPPFHLNEIDSICYGVHAMGFITEDKNEKTLEDEYVKGDVQIQEHPQLSYINRSNDVNNNFVGFMN